MRTLLAILFLGVCLAGCSAGPSPSLVRDLKHAAVSATAKSTGRPESNRTVQRTARSYLRCSQMAEWIGLEAHDGPSDPTVGWAIQNAFPRRPMLTEDRVRALASAANSLPK